jgi:hypothetical protein
MVERVSDAHEWGVENENGRVSSRTVAHSRVVASAIENRRDTTE